MGQDQVLNDAIATARDQFELRTDVAIMSQTWELTLKALPRDLRLPKPPLNAIPAVAIAYDDADGAQQTFDPSNYRVFSGGYSNARIVLGDDVTLPATSGTFPWQITFTAGKTDAADVWDGIRGAILLLAAYLYEHRITAYPAQVIEVPHAFEAIVAQYRVYWP